MVLIFPSAPCRAYERFGILPRTSAYALLLESIGVFLGSVVHERWVNVVHCLYSSLGIYGAGPFSHVARHVEQAVAVRLINANLGCDKVAVLGVIAAVGLEIGKETAVATLHALVLPWELCA